jgi:tRNA threonylcarbamoyladenosine biosynthesis protein TsaB
MIDARRMEVFTIIYDQDLNEKHAPFALILDQSSFEEELAKNKMIFVGNATTKWKNICSHPNALYSEEAYQVRDLAEIAARRFEEKNFTSLAYSEPFYLKSFYTGAAK